MSNRVVVAVVPLSAVRPAHIGKAAAARGLTPVFVTVAGEVSEEERAEYTGFGRVLEADPRRPEETVERLRGLTPAGILTFSEGALALTTALAAGLGLPFHDAEVLQALTDKWAQRRRLAAAGVDAVRCELVTSRQEALSALAGRAEPTVVKPRRSQSSRDTYLIEPGADLPAQVCPGPDRPFLLEEYLPGRDEGELGDYVSVESLVVDGEPFTLGVTGKFPLLPPFREQGQFIPSQLPPSEHAAVARLAADAARALGVRRGLVHTEIKLTPGGPRIIEVNGRLGGFQHELQQRAAGQDLLELALAVACGLPVSPVAVGTDGPVRFQYGNLTPAGGGTLVAVRGSEELLAEPGVSGYLSRVAPGSTLEPAVATHFADLVFGEAPDHRALLDLLDRILPGMRHVYRAPDGSLTELQPTRHGLVPAPREADRNPEDTETESSP